MPVPLIPDKADHPSILSPEVLAQHSSSHGWLDGHAAPEAAVLVYHRGLAEQYLESRNHVVARGFLADYFLLDDFDRRIALVANFGIGSPAAVFTFEDLIGAGTKTILSVGTCGAVQPDLVPGTLILPTSALRDEGTSYHYLPDGEVVTPDAILLDAIRNKIARADAVAVEGPCWTTDAPYRETPHELRLHRADGVVAVEMEAAALFAVAKVRKIPVGSLLAVSDVLEESNWTPSFHAEETLKSLHLALDIALAVLSD